MPMYWKRMRPLSPSEIDAQLKAYSHLQPYAVENGDEGVLLVVPVGALPETIRKAIREIDSNEKWEQIHAIHIEPQP